MGRTCIPARWVILAALLFHAASAVNAQAAAQGEWEPIGPSGGGQQLVFLSSKGALLCSHPNGGVFRSEDKGQSWRIVRATKRDARGMVDVGFLAMAQAPEGIYAGGPQGLWLSDDEGRSWQNVPLKCEDLAAGGPPPYVVSIAVLGRRHLALGCCVDAKKGGSFEGILELKGERELQINAHKIRGSRKKARGKPVVRVAYDDDFAGEPTVFAISYSSGLFECSNLDSKRWRCKSVRLPKDIEGKATGLCVDARQDAVYVGTSAFEIARGTPGEKGIEWDVCSPRKKAEEEGRKIEDPAALIYALVADPFKPARIWWGSGGTIEDLYDAPETKTYRGWAEWRGPKGASAWTAFRPREGSALSIALDPLIASRPGKEGERNAAVLYVAQPSANGVLATTDGGLKWSVLNKGVSGVRVNRVCCFAVDRSPGVAVAGESSSELSWDGGSRWEEKCSLRPDPGSGVTHGLLGIPRRYRKIALNRAELLAARGLPSPDPALGGLYVVWAAGGVAQTARARQLFREPAAGIFVDPLNDRYAFLPLQVGGVAAYDLKEQRVLPLDKGLPGEGGRCADDMRNRDALGTFALAFSRNKDWTVAFVSTVHGLVTEDSLYALRGKGGIYRALPLYEGWELRDDVAWQRIDPPERDENEEAGMFLALACEGTRLVALGSTGEVYATEDAFAPEVKWCVHGVRVTQPPGAAQPVFTGMAVRWESGDVYVSTLEGGVFHFALKDAFGEAGGITARPFLRGLGTRRIRSLALSADGKWLFAGSDGTSVWRCAVAGR